MIYKKNYWKIVFKNINFDTNALMSQKVFDDKIHKQIQ